MFKKNGKLKDQSYPILLHDNMVSREDVDKANLFGTLLSETFKDNNTNKFDQNFKNEVEDEMKAFINDYKDEKNSFDFINLKNLDEFLKKTKSTISSGEDKISNILLKNLNSKFKFVFLHLFRTTIKTVIIPSRWKKVLVRMIPKKDDGKKDPKTIVLSH